MRYCPNRIVFLISSSFDFRNKEPGEESEDDAAVVDYVEEQLDFEEPERIVVGTHVEIDTRGKRTRNRGATSAHFGSFPD